MNRCFQQIHFKWEVQFALVRMRRGSHFAEQPISTI